MNKRQGFKGQAGRRTPRARTARQAHPGMGPENEAAATPRVSGCARSEPLVLVEVGA